MVFLELRTHDLPEIVHIEKKAPLSYMSGCIFAGGVPVRAYQGGVRIDMRRVTWDHKNTAVFMLFLPGVREDLWY